MHRIIVPLIAASLAGCATPPLKQTAATHPANPEAPTGAIVTGRALAPVFTELPAEGHGAPVQQTAEPTVPQSSALYMCPMHPNVTSSDPEARCPECGMKINKPIATEEPA